MKPKQLHLLRFLTLGPAIVGMTLQSAHAASGTWNTTATNGNWEAEGTEANWSTGAATFPGNLATPNADAATFNSNSNFSSVAINGTTSNSSPLFIGGIFFTGAGLATNYTIGSTSGNTLTVNSNANQTSTVNQIAISGAGRTGATIAVTETINAPIVLGAQSGVLAGFYAFQNNSTVLTNGDALILNGAVSGGTTTQGITLTLRGGSLNANNAVSGVISNGGAALGVGITKNDAGTWSVSGANTYSGTTTVTGGILNITGSNSGGGAYTVNTGTLAFNPSGTVNASSINITALNSNVNVNGGTVIVSGAITATATSNSRILNLNGGTLQVGTSVFAPVLANVVRFNGGTLKSGNAAGITFESTVTTTTSDHTATVLAGGATLDTTIGNITSGALFNGTAAGAITVKGGNTFTSNVTNTGLLTIQDNSIWDIGGTGGAGASFLNSSVGGVSGNGSIVNSSATDGTLTINFASSAGPFTYSGNIAPATTSRIALIKSGTGTQILSGANTYSGATTVSAGKLVVNGNVTTSVVTVATGATIGGSGTVGGNLTVDSGAVLAPGNSAGNLTLGNGLALAGTYSWELAALSTANPGTDFDTVTVTAGSVDISGAGLQLSLGAFAPTAIAFWQTDQTWEDIINNTGIGSLTGSFAAIDNSAWSLLGAFSTTTTDNDVNLVWTAAVPEPASSASLGFAGVLMMLYRRRSTQK